MVPIVQLVRASDCGSECRGFESHWAPKKKPKGFFFCVLVALQQRKVKQRKILIFNENRDFLFSQKTQKSAVHDRLWWSKR